MAAPKEKSVSQALPEDIWMLRPCEIYLEEYSDCASYKGRFHQYYTQGSYADCERWQQNYKKCLQFRNTGDISAAESILSSEAERRTTRLAGARGNDVWEYRHAPPTDWSSPLAGRLGGRQDSVLARVQAHKDSTTATQTPPHTAPNRCVVS
ncbi:hypothetical protein ACOMHN_023518 [Nucella lapillus]